MEKLKFEINSAINNPMGVKLMKIIIFLLGTFYFNIYQILKILTIPS